LRCEWGGEPKLFGVEGFGGEGIDCQVMDETKLIFPFALSLSLEDWKAARTLVRIVGDIVNIVVVKMELGK
jgi:hypothetical protein